MKINNEITFKSSSVFDKFNSISQDAKTPIPTASNHSQVTNPPMLTSPQTDTFITKDKIINKKSIVAKGLGITALLGSIAFAAYKISKGKKPDIKITNKTTETVSDRLDIDYIKSLATDMTKALGKKIEISQIESVMGKEELLSILPKLKPVNFNAYVEQLQKQGPPKKILNIENLNNGIFKIDLHSHTNYSDGVGKVSEILDNIASYADKLYEKTGEKFIFAITDHDGIGGAKEALKIIAENSDKYKNLRFIPGVELSFVHQCEKGDNPTEVAELLAHCINPYSDTMNKFIDELTTKRSNMIKNMTEELSSKIKDVNFNKNEVQGLFIDMPHELFAHNLHWRMYNYAQIKQRMTGLAKQWSKEPEAIYSEIMPQWHIGRGMKSPYNFETFMGNRNVDLSKTVMKRNDVEEICRKYFPKIENGVITSQSERTFEEITDFFSKEKGTILGFAHPAFTTQRYNNPEKAIEEFIQKSNGLIQTTERHHQAYNIPIQTNKMTQDFVDKTNRIIDKFNLLNVGGHDNHGPVLLPKE